MVAWLNLPPAVSKTIFYTVFEDNSGTFVYLLIQRPYWKSFLTERKLNSRPLDSSLIPFAGNLFSPSYLFTHRKETLFLFIVTIANFLSFGRCTVHYATWPYAGIQTGRFVLSSDGPKSALEEAKALLGWSGGMLPRENFGKMELNLAISCILGVKQSNCSMVRLQKNMQKVDKNIFRSLERTFVAEREGSSEPPEPPLGTGLLHVHSP